MTAVESDRRSTGSAAWRFVVAGGVNTLVTGIALSLLSLVIDPRIAYAIVFAAGIGLAVVLADKFVFGVRMSTRSKLLYVGLYLLVFLVGLGVVQLLMHFGVPAFASGAVVLVTAPLNFVGGRLITRRDRVRK